MERIIAEDAPEEHVGYIRRFALLQRAANAGVKDLVAWDGLHSSAAGHECVGRALARMIHAAARKSARRLPRKVSADGRWREQLIPRVKPNRECWATRPRG